MPVTCAHLSVSSFSQHFVHRLFSIQRLQEHSTAFNSCYRYNACRHAASTSMYAQVRHPWRTWPVHVIPKGRTCAPSSQHFAALCLSATFDTTLAGTQQVHPCMLMCTIHGAQALYALYRNTQLALLRPSSYPPDLKLPT